MRGYSHLSRLNLMVEGLCHAPLKESCHFCKCNRVMKSILHGTSFLVAVLGGLRRPQNLIVRYHLTRALPGAGRPKVRPLHCCSTGEQMPPQPNLLQPKEAQNNPVHDHLLSDHGYMNPKRRCCQKKKCAGTQWRPRMGETRVASRMLLIISRCLP